MHLLFPAQVKHKRNLSSLTADQPEEEKKSEEVGLKDVFVFIGNQRKKQLTCRQQEGRSHWEEGGRIQPGCPKDERILDSNRRSGQCWSPDCSHTHTHTSERYHTLLCGNISRTFTCPTCLWSHSAFWWSQCLLRWDHRPGHNRTLVSWLPTSACVCACVFVSVCAWPPAQQARSRHQPEGTWTAVKRTPPPLWSSWAAAPVPLGTGSVSGRCWTQAANQNAALSAASAVSRHHTYPPNERCTAPFTAVINSARPAHESGQRSHRWESIGQRSDTLCSGPNGIVTPSYRLPAGVGYWTGTGAGRQEEPEESGREPRESEPEAVMCVSVCVCPSPGQGGPPTCPGPGTSTLRWCSAGLAAEPPACRCCTRPQWCE